jgi:hypothetical protein
VNGPKSARGVVEDLQYRQRVVLGKEHEKNVTSSDTRRVGSWQIIFIVPIADGFTPKRSSEVSTILKSLIITR